MFVQTLGRPLCPANIFVGRIGNPSHVVASSPHSVNYVQMNADQQHQLDECIKLLRSGTLTEEGLRRTFGEACAAGNGQQKLLYLQARTTRVDSEVMGMSIVEDGQFKEGPDGPEDWPYKTVLEAINDGWRVIKFPELALLLEEDKTFGLGCEFVLEK